jgi:hypothetical protein
MYDLISVEMTLEQIKQREIDKEYLTKLGWIIDRYMCYSPSHLSKSGPFATVDAAMIEQKRLDDLTKLGVSYAFCGSCKEFIEPEVGMTSSAPGCYSYQPGICVLKNEYRKYSSVCDKWNITNRPDVQVFYRDGREQVCFIKEDEDGTLYATPAGAYAEPPSVWKSREIEMNKLLKESQ